jgi:hypothetical protein
MPIPRFRFLALITALWLAFAAGATVADCGPIYSCAQLVYLGLTYPYRQLSGSYLFIDSGHQSSGSRASPRRRTAFGLDLGRRSARNDCAGTFQALLSESSLNLR